MFTAAAGGGGRKLQYLKIPISGWMVLSGSEKRGERRTMAATLTGPMSGTVRSSLVIKTKQ
jgi:hypothetical protein